MFRRWSNAFCVALLGFSVGCSCTREACAPAPAGYQARFVPATLPAHPLTPGDAAPMPVGPPESAFTAPPMPQATAPLQPVPSPASPPASPPPSRLTPAPTPPASSAEPARPEVRLTPPANTGTTDQLRPVVAEERSPVPPLPVGIPQFSVVSEGLTAGLKPSLDGLDWLKAKGYRTVVFIHAPGENDSADRQVVEARGMAYRSIDVSPDTLSRAAVGEFSRLVSDPAARPLFVYDRSGPLAGALWYLHFRLSERDSDEVARVRAARLGLGDDPANGNRAMWLAIQRLLSEQSR